jgi:hypothetical protein
MGTISNKSKAIFEAKLPHLLIEAQKGVAVIRREFNAKGLLNSSMTVRAVYDCIENHVRICSTECLSSVKLSIESSAISINKNSPPEILEAFNEIFANSALQLKAIGEEFANPICAQLGNKSFIEWGDFDLLIRSEQLLKTEELRKLYIDSMNKRRKWYEYIPIVTNIIRIFKSL